MSKAPGETYYVSYSSVSIPQLDLDTWSIRDIGAHSIMVRTNIRWSDICMVAFTGITAISIVSNNIPSWKNTIDTIIGRTGHLFSNTMDCGLGQSYLLSSG